ncbi:hypothetical protein [Allopusillimonas ginsengisoli]|uniref:hypothetical protein n=1 Tax=Allopusillimonas ginsengisoli TaxID=453575 RepID=UPI0010209797|nr:hypothetical protein [Allopusillimonas ginsengisoli]TEA74152.1 hypothetical protein ERE07_18925 [Allopusillimonas ginsengisoli]
MSSIRTALIALALGFLSQLAQHALETDYLNAFLRNNLLTILIALLAINSATTGIVLTKIRGLMEMGGNGSTFKSTREQMVLAVREQVALIVVAIAALTVASSPILPQSGIVELFFESLVVGVFAYSLFVLYDTAVGVLIIIDFDPSAES